MLQTTLSGTEFIFQGQEIGMTDMPEDWDINDFRDPGASNYMLSQQAFEHKKNGYEAGVQAYENARKGNLKFGRDNGRTPVHWTGGQNAGFSDIDEGKCWIGVHYNCKDGINIADQQQDPDSIWHFWKKSIQLRKKYRSALVHGSFEILDPDNQSSFTYVKRSETGQIALVCLNFSDQAEEICLPENHERDGHFHCISSNYGNAVQDFSPLRAWEGRLYLAGIAHSEKDSEGFETDGLPSPGTWTMD